MPVYKSNSRSQCPIRALCSTQTGDRQAVCTLQTRLHDKSVSATMQHIQCCCKPICTLYSVSGVDVNKHVWKLRYASVTASCECLEQCASSSSHVCWMMIAVLSTRMLMQDIKQCKAYQQTTAVSVTDKLSAGNLTSQNTRRADHNTLLILCMAVQVVNAQNPMVQ